MGPTPPLAILQLTVTPSAVPAGETSEGTVLLTSAAPADGVMVALTSSDGAVVVPASMTIPGGLLVGRFTVRTRLVAADSAGTITGAAGGQTREAVLRVMAPVPRPPTLQSLDVEPSTLKGGQTAQGAVRLTSPALAGGLVVSVESSNAAATVPRSVVVPVGAASATFTIQTRPVTLETVFEITASFSDQLRAVRIHLLP
jgi:hypothetical protein